jgi:bifunctional DNA-binding transcriptional regulator/antitoxin component of YhaV-PrlF toxin-antitoxin module/phage gp16-like protein
MLAGRVPRGPAGSPLDLRGLAPRRLTAPVMWRHRIRRLDGRGRLPVPEVVQLPGGEEGLQPMLRADRWELVASGRSGGIHVDARRRVLVPLGVRHQLELRADVVVSVAVDGSRLVVWPVSRPGPPPGAAVTGKQLRARVALRELEAMGLSVADLVAVADGDGVARPAGPTVAEYVPVVAASYQPRSQRTYGSYWRLLVELVGEVAVDRVAVDDLLGVADEAVRRAKTRRPGSDGRASRESCIAAMRAVFRRAHTAGLTATNPALQVPKPRRLPNRRRALTQIEVEQVWAAVAATTRDSQLDLLLVRFHLESGARRMGAINLRRHDVDARRQTVWLREKFGSEREQAISRSLLEAVLELADSRGATAGCPHHRG